LSSQKRLTTKQGAYGKDLAKKLGGKCGVAALLTLELWLLYINLLRRIDGVYLFLNIVD
jgi:hypothetical protein